MSTHRRNHLRAWPKRLQDGDIPTGDGTFRPFSDSLDGVQQNQCRRTKLRFYGTVSADILDEITFDFTVNSNGQKHGGERGSIRGQYGFVESFYIAADGTKTDSPGTGGIVAVNFVLGAPGGNIVGDAYSGAVVQDASHYFIPFYLEIGYGDILIFDDQRAAYPVSTYNLTLLSNAVPMYSQFGSDFSGSMIIGDPPIGGYFEFRDKNGANPVYDPNTGARLINPIPQGL